MLWSHSHHCQDYSAFQTRLRKYHKFKFISSSIPTSRTCPSTNSIHLFDPNQPWNYQHRPLSSIIFHYKTVAPDIITMIFMSDCFNPLQTLHEIWDVYELGGLNWDRDENSRTILKPVSLISRLATSHHRNPLNKIIDKQNTNSSFSETIEWTDYRIMETSMSPSAGWWLKHYKNDAERNLFRKNLFIFLIQSDRRIGE